MSITTIAVKIYPRKVEKNINNGYLEAKNKNN